MMTHDMEVRFEQDTVYFKMITGVAAHNKLVINWLPKMNDPMNKH